MVHYKDLDKFQREATICDFKNTLVVAPPGSGKTTVIINRIVHLIKDIGVNPYNIVVITFTKSAATNMKERYKKIMNNDKSPFFGTFHGLFYKILSRYYGKINILGSGEAFGVINAILSKYLDTINEDKVKEVLNDISLLKTSGKDIDNFESKIDKTIFKNCFIYYEDYKKEKQLFDFDDLQLIILNLFDKDTKLLNSYKRLFKYILVDEFQDCDNLQIEILKRLTDGNSLFAVGDEDQCIYSFRGSKPECMVNFNSYFYNGEKIYLKYNYRSAKNIVDASKNLIAHNKMRNNKLIKAYNNHEKNITVHNFFNEREESKYIAQSIKDIINKGYNPEQIAVLYRTNMESRTITDVFLKYAIKFRLLDKGYNFFEHFICKDIIAYMKLSLNPWDKNSFFKIINKPFRYISRLNLDRIRNSDDGDCFDVLKNQKDIKPFQLKNIEKLEKDILSLKKKSAQEAINFVFDKLGYKDYLKEYSRRIKSSEDEFSDVVYELIESSKDYVGIIPFLTHVDEMKEEINKKDKNEEGVILSTIHGVKGMEFKNVFIVNCNEENIPYQKDGKVDVEEERRLFYVAITRTIDDLYICSTKSIRGDLKNPSRFIKECNLLNVSLGNIKKEDQDIIIHNHFGEGKIVKEDNNFLSVKFLDNIIRKFNKEILFRDKLIKRKK